MTSGYEAMSEYERRAWDEAVRRLNDLRERKARAALRGAGERVRSVAGKGWNQLPKHEFLEEQLQAALSGLTSVTLQPAMHSVNLTRVVRRVGAESLDDFRSLDLSKLDAASPRNRLMYTGAAFIEGGATALAVTGAEVATTVSGGTTASVAIGAVAADVSASIVLLGRITAHVAAQYGYDVRQPDEEVFALGVISIGSAGSPGAKVAALSSLSRLTQQMMRHATWKELNKHGLVKLVDAIFQALGLRLTHAKLSQAIPFVGVGLNGGLSAQMADQTMTRARHVYRLRFLSDKYGIDPSAWVTHPEQQGPPDDVLGLALDEFDDGAGPASDGEG